MSNKHNQLKAPFPYFGGKSTVAAAVWERVGDVKNYVEPFFGSGAVLLSRPHSPRVETVNDLNAWLTNFWRALQHDPAGVAAWCDYPVSEIDLHSRGDHIYFHDGVEDFITQLREDPEYYDVQLAGWWVYYVSGSIAGGGFARRDDGDNGDNVPRRRPELGGRGGGSGVHKLSLRVTQTRPAAVAAGGATGVCRQSLLQVARAAPHMGNAGCGVNRKSLQVARAVPHIGDAGRAVHRQSLRVQHSLPSVGKGGQRGVARLSLLHEDAGRVSYKVPMLSRRGQGIHSVSVRENLTAYLQELADRLRGVRICCGDWSRVVTPTVTVQHGLTAVFLDPPYSLAERDGDLYAVDRAGVAAEVREWCLANGDNPLLRIALCGYDTEHGDAMPDSWECFRWRAHGGYGNQGNGRGRSNRDRECIWFSPHCLKPRRARQMGLFGGA